MKSKSTTAMITIAAIASIASFHQPGKTLRWAPTRSKYHTVAVHQVGFNTVNPVGEILNLEECGLCDVRPSWPIEA